MHEMQTDGHSQGEDFVPLWIEVLVNSMCLQSVIIQLQHTERIALTWETVLKLRDTQRYMETESQPVQSTGCMMSTSGRSLDYR